MIRGYTDEGRVHVGAFVPPAVKRQLVELAFHERVTVSDVIRSALSEKLATGRDDARALILQLLDERGQMESDQLDALVAEQAGVTAKTVRNLRGDLKNKGLIRPVPDRDESGVVKRWFVARTNAPVPEPEPTSALYKKSGSSSSSAPEPAHTYKALASGSGQTLPLGPSRSPYATTAPPTAEYRGPEAPRCPPARARRQRAHHAERAARDRDGAQAVRARR